MSTGTITLSPRPSTRRRLLQVAVLWGVGFQAFHAFEHVLQVGYWFLHPTAAPWLTPWAAVGRDIAAVPIGGAEAGGAELLHLVGNVVFALGLLALWALHRVDDRRPPSTLRVAGLAQGFHLAEHALLTVSWFATGEALGVTTVFGQVQGPLASSLRVWSHLLLNLVPTVAVLAAIGTTYGLPLGRARRLGGDGR